MTGHPQLLAVIRNEIETCGPMTFARFMELALYHPQFGYYMSGQVRVGKEGDYFTSPTVGPLFGRFLGMQFAEMWEVMGKPKPFVLLELGSNRGWLAEDVMSWARERRPDFAEAIDYWTCERGGGRELRVESREPERGREFRNWREIPDEAVMGCIFSNELVDAFPVHRIRRTAHEWTELHVTWEDGKLGWVVRPLTISSDDFPLPLQYQPFADGYATEVNAQSLDWMDQMARILKSGFLMTIDYGYEESEYYAPYRTDGTLLCYHKHRSNNELLERVGEQDITAHVNFTALMTRGKQVGMYLNSFTNQSQFLVRIGKKEIERIISANPGKPDKTRQQLQMLLNPADMGRTFKVLVQQKWIEGDEMARPV